MNSFGLVLLAKYVPRFSSYLLPRYSTTGKHNSCKPTLLSIPMCFNKLAKEATNHL